MAGIYTLLALSRTSVVVILGTHVCQTALVVTNDSDLAYPLEVVQTFGVRVILVNPFLQARHGAAGLRRIPVYRRLQLQEHHRRESQLPDPVLTAQGRSLVRPDTWT